jgi:hypothetical protein
MEGGTGTENTARYYNPAHSRPWSWAAVAFCTLLVIPILPGFERLLFRTLPPFGLKVQAEGDQLRISWNPLATSRRARLDIFDGGEHTTVFISGNMTNATYAPRTADVDVRLAPMDTGAAPGLETVHYVRHVPAPAPPVAIVTPQPAPRQTPKPRAQRARKSAVVERPAAKEAYFFR